MIYLILFWLVSLTSVVIILYLESRMKKEAKEIWTLPALGTTVSAVGDFEIANNEPQFVEFLGADRVNDILAEKKDVKIDDILTN